MTCITNDIYSQLVIKKYFYEKYGIKSIKLFGSVARGEDNENSDIDLLVEFDYTKPMNFDRFFGIIEEIEHKFKRKVDLAENLKKIYPDLEIIDWGQITDFDMIINATSLGLKNNDQIQLDLSKVGKGKLFYDVIYNPTKTNFLLEGEKKGNQTENGKMMFIYQAQLAFKIWHNILPKVDIKILD